MVLQSASSAVGGYIVQITLSIGGAVVVLQVWILRWLVKLEKNTSATSVTLFGERGANGINGDVKKHTDEIRDHEVRIVRTETRLHLLDGGAL